jgi:hypothetical protein
MRGSNLEPLGSGQTVLSGIFTFRPSKQTLFVQLSSGQCLSLPNTSSENLRYGQRGNGAVISTTERLIDLTKLPWLPVLCCDLHDPGGIEMTRPMHK